MDVRDSANISKAFGRSRRRCTTSRPRHPLRRTDGAARASGSGKTTLLRDDRRARKRRPPARSYFGEEDASKHAGAASGRSASCSSTTRCSGT